MTFSVMIRSEPQVITILLVTTIIITSLFTPTMQLASLPSAETCYGPEDTLITVHLQAHACDYRKPLEVILVTDYKQTWMGPTVTSRECLWKCVRNRTTCRAVTVYRNGNDVTWTCHLMQSVPSKSNVFKVEFLLDGLCTFYTVQQWGCSKDQSSPEATTTGSGSSGGGIVAIDEGQHPLPNEPPSEETTTVGDPGAILMNDEGQHPLPPEPPSEEATTLGDPGAILMNDEGQHPLPPEPPSEEATTIGNPGAILMNDQGQHPLPPEPPSEEATTLGDPGAILMNDGGGNGFPFAPLLLEGTTPSVEGFGAVVMNDGGNDYPVPPPPADQTTTAVATVMNDEGPIPLPAITGMR